LAKHEILDHQHALDPFFYENVERLAVFIQLEFDLGLLEGDRAAREASGAKNP